MLSRVADSLYWMSRYIERAENNARIADVNLQLLLDLDEHARPRYAAAVESDHQLAGRERAFHFALSKPRRPGRDRFRLSAKERIRTRFTPVSPRARENARTDARTNLERDVGADQSPLSFREERDRQKDAAFEPVRIFQAHHHRLASVPGNHGRHHDAWRRLGFHSHREIARARRLHFSDSRCEISHPPARRAKASAATSIPFNGCRF